MVRGVAGVVTDGGFRDSAEIAQLDIPTYHNRPSAPTNLTLHQAININVPIGCGDAPVFPGDVVVGDADGVIIVPAEIADEIANDAVEMTAYEDFVIERVRGGQKPWVSTRPPTKPTWQHSTPGGSRTSVEARRHPGKARRPRDAAMGQAQSRFVAETPQRITTMSNQTVTRPRILIARRVPDAVAARAREVFDAVIAEQDMDADTVIRATRECRSQAIFSDPKVRLDAGGIAALPEAVRIIANPSAGYDHMDAAAARARARAVIVINTPDVLTDCTADLAFLLILAACRRAGEYYDIMRAGWRKPYGMPDNLGKRPSGQTLGIVGMGRIGRAVAKRARGFDMKILYNDQQGLPPEMAQGAELVADLRDMLPRCGILSLHAPGRADGTPLMTRELFGLLPPGAVFVNAARGSLVDEDALIEALTSGHLFAAGLDVSQGA
jgi:lactate dehydrogenase-like 2-hydroxyacid dehydrogenase